MSEAFETPGDWLEELESQEGYDAEEIENTLESFFQEIEWLEYQNFFELDLTDTEQVEQFKDEIENTDLPEDFKNLLEEFLDQMANVTADEQRQISDLRWDILSMLEELSDSNLDYHQIADNVELEQVQDITYDGDKFNVIIWWQQDETLVIYPEDIDNSNDLKNRIISELIGQEDIEWVDSVNYDGEFRINLNKDLVDSEEDQEVVTISWEEIESKDQLESKIEENLDKKRMAKEANDDFIWELWLQNLQKISYDVDNWNFVLEFEEGSASIDWENIHDIHDLKNELLAGGVTPEDIEGVENIYYQDGSFYVNLWWEEEFQISPEWVETVDDLEQRIQERVEEELSQAEELDQEEEQEGLLDRISSIWGEGGPDGFFWKIALTISAVAEEMWLVTSRQDLSDEDLEEKSQHHWETWMESIQTFDLDVNITKQEVVERLNNYFESDEDGLDPLSADWNDIRDKLSNYQQQEEIENDSHWIIWADTIYYLFNLDEDDVSLERLRSVDFLIDFFYQTEKSLSELNNIIWETGDVIGDNTLEGIEEAMEDQETREKLLDFFQQWLSGEQDLDQQDQEILDYIFWEYMHQILSDRNWEQEKRDWDEPSRHWEEESGSSEDSAIQAGWIDDIEGIDQEEIWNYYNLQEWGATSFFVIPNSWQVLDIRALQEALNQQGVDLSSHWVDWYIWRETIEAVIQFQLWSDNYEGEIDWKIWPQTLNALAEDAENFDYEDFLTEEVEAGTFSSDSADVPEQEEMESSDELPWIESYDQLLEGNWSAFAQYDETIQGYAEEYWIPKNLLLNLLIGEGSGGDPGASNPNSTAYWLWQILDWTWQDINARIAPMYGLETGQLERDDPDDQILATCLYLRYMYDQHANDWREAVVYYHTGPGMTESDVREFLDANPAIKNQLWDDDVDVASYQEAARNHYS